MAFLGTWLTWACMLVLSVVVMSSPIPSAPKDLTPTVDIPTPIQPNIDSTPHMGISEPSISLSPLSKPKEAPRDGSLQGSTLVGALFSGGILDEALKSVAPQ